MPSIGEIALLANTGSGSGDADAAEEWLRRSGAELAIYSPDRAEEAARSGAARLLVAGGDGSIAPAACAAASAGIPLGVIPVGTANDFAAAAGLPGDLDAACRLAAEGGETRPVDLGWAGERPFVNLVSAGLSPAAARRASGLKRPLGAAAYLAGAVAAGFRARPVRCALACDGRAAFDGEAWQVSVGCSGAFGGGASIGGELGDGMLRAVAVPAGPRVALLWRAYGLRRGRIGAQAGTVTESCRGAELGVEEGTELNVDGELVESGPVELRVEPAAFELVVG